MKKQDLFTNTDEIEALRARVERDELSADDKAMIVRLLALLVKLVRLLQEKNTKIKQLKKWLFGPFKGQGSANNADSAKTTESPSADAATDPDQEEPQGRVQDTVGEKRAAVGAQDLEKRARKSSIRLRINC